MLLLRHEALPEHDLPAVWSISVRHAFMDVTRFNVLYVIAQENKIKLDQSGRVQAPG